MTKKQKERPAPPEVGPYVFPVILAVLGIWCFYDGWLTTDPEMQEHVLFNRVGSVVLLSWAIIDFYRTFKTEKAEGAATKPNSDKRRNDSES